MNKQTKRYYDELTASLRHWHPNQEKFTYDQINQIAIPDWGETVRELDTKREGALEAIREIVEEPDQRGALEGKVSEYFDQRQESFEAMHSEVLSEVYRQNDINPELEQTAPVQEQSPDVHTATRYAYKGDDAIDLFKNAGPKVEFLSDDHPGSLKGRIANVDSLRPTNPPDPPAGGGGAGELSGTEKNIPPAAFIHQHESSGEQPGFNDRQMRVLAALEAAYAPQPPAPEPPTPRPDYGYDMSM